MTLATGVGSWPGTDVGEALRTVRDLLAGLEGEVTGLAYLPELPARGPGADIIGRAAGLLVEMPVDLQPAGWRLVDRPGRDAARTRSLWQQDLDELAEAFDGYAGRLKVQVAGPWTLAASVWLTRGERAVVDEGATRDLIASLAEGLSGLLEQLGRQVPGAELVVQVDEPSLPAVLEGRLPTASGYGRLPAAPQHTALAGLQEVLAAAGDRHTLVHCCSDHVPMATLRASGASGISVDTSLLTPRGWEGVAVAVEEGLTLYAGCRPDARIRPTAARAGRVRSRGLVGPARPIGRDAGPGRRVAGLRPGRRPARRGGLVAADLHRRRPVPCRARARVVRL